MRRHFCFTFTIFTMIIGVLAGCGENDGEKSGANSSPTNSTLRLAVSTSATDSGLMHVLIPLFEGEQLFQPLRLPEGNAISDSRGSGHVR